MLTNSLISLINSALPYGSKVKYQIKQINYDLSNNTSLLVCEDLEQNSTVSLSAEEIIKDNKFKFFSTSDLLLLSKVISGYESIAEGHTTVTQEKKYFNILTVAFSLFLIMSNLAEIKICDFFGYSIGAGTLVFPLVYILNDVLTEVYGFSNSRKAIWLALVCNCLLSLFMYIVIMLPPSQYWEDQAVFEKIFLVSPRIVIASIIAYLVGEMVNASIIALLKIRFLGKLFAVRAIFSTFLGSLVESAMFGYIAFWGRLPNSEINYMIWLLTIIKVAYELFSLPLTIRFVRFLKKAEGLDIYERPTLKAALPHLW